MSAKINSVEGSNMTYGEKLQRLIDNGDGILLASEVSTAGIPNEYVSQFVRQGKLERVAHGVYIFPNELADNMYILQQHKHSVVFSHETALFLHNLTDRDPITYSVTVPSGYRNISLQKKNLTVYFVKRELLSVGLIEIENMFGHKIRTYNMERTICDIIRSRNKLDIAVVTDAVKQYARRQDKNLNLLMEYAELFKVNNQLQRYMEVLL